MCFIEVLQHEVGKRGRWRMCRWKGKPRPRFRMEGKDVMEKMDGKNIYKGKAISHEMSFTTSGPLPPLALG